MKLSKIIWKLGIFGRLWFRLEAYGRPCTCDVEPYLGDILHEDFYCPYHFWLYRLKWKIECP